MRRGEFKISSAIFVPAERFSCGAAAQDLPALAHLKNQLLL